MIIVDKEYLKKRLNIKLQKYDLKQNEAIVTSPIEISKHSFFKEDLLFLDISNPDLHIGFGYDKIQLLNIKSRTCEDVNFLEINEVSINYEPIYQNTESLVKAKFEANELAIHKNNGSIKEIHLAKNGVIDVYKGLLDLVIFLLQKSKK